MVSLCVDAPLVFQGCLYKWTYADRLRNRRIMTTTCFRQLPHMRKKTCLCADFIPTSLRNPTEAIAIVIDDDPQTERSRVKFP